MVIQTSFILDHLKVKITEYWHLVVERCQASRAEILSHKWLVEEDIDSSSPTRYYFLASLNFRSFYFQF